MIKKLTIGALALAAALALAGAPGSSTGLVEPGVASAATKGQTKEFEGRVLRINRSNKTFVQRRGDGRGKVRIKVNKRTRWENLSGFKALRKGMKVETRARYNGKRWVAKKVEREDRD